MYAIFLIVIYFIILLLRLFLFSFLRIESDKIPNQGVNLDINNLVV